MASQTPEVPIASHLAKRGSSKAWNYTQFCHSWQRWLKPSLSLWGSQASQEAVKRKYSLFLWPFTSVLFIVPYPTSISWIPGIILISTTLLLCPTNTLLLNRLGCRKYYHHELWSLGRGKGVKPQLSCGFIRKPLCYKHTSGVCQIFP